MNHPEHRIPSLDGLRAIAISLVVLAHLTWNQRLLGHQGAYLALGHLGVRLFFVLSGFLITGILLREIDDTGTLSLARFYFRRTLRIFPAFYTFVGVMILANTLPLAHLYHGSVVPVVSYTADYLLPATRVFGHTWSLAVEEQFYLLWPAALLLLGRQRAFWLAGLLLLACPLLRVADLVLLTQHGGIASPLQNPLFRFDNQADALALGCLLAGFRARLHRQAWYRRLLASPAFIVVPLLGLAIAEMEHQESLPLLAAFFLAGQTLTNVAMALSLDWCLTHPSGTVGRVLNAPPVAAVGVLSYSIYLWQEPFLYVGRSAWWQVPPANLALTLLAAGASYLLIERPCLRRRRHWEQRIFAPPSAAAGPRWAGSLRGAAPLRGWSNGFVAPHGPIVPERSRP